MTPKCSQEQEALKPQSRKRKRKRLRNANKTNQKKFIYIDIDMLVNYCLGRVTWEEARPVVEVMERQELQTPSPALSAAIDKIKRHFNRKIYVAGAMYDIHDNENVYIDGVLQKRQQEQTPKDDEAWEAVELRFFNMKKYGSDEKQQRLRKVLRYASTRIDTSNGRDWFCVYAAERYVENCTGCKLEYVEFFTDIETLLPGVLKGINQKERGYKRYKGYSELLRREADNWFVFNGCLPLINEMVYSMALGCTDDQFKKYSRIIKDLYKKLKEI